MSMLDTLPVELLYEIQLFALSPALPIVNKRTHSIFSATNPSYRTKYLLCKYAAARAKGLKAAQKGVVSFSIRSTLCEESVLDRILTFTTNALSNPTVAEQSTIIAPSHRTELPRRLFSSLTPSHTWTPDSPPLPFLRQLYHGLQKTGLPNPDVNAHKGYALSRAVHAEHIPLIRFLLSHGANPNICEALPVKLAIRKKDLALVKLLVERTDEGNTAVGSKRRKLEDRIQITTGLLRDAVTVDARDVVAYFMQEKGVRPDFTTLERLIRRIDAPPR